MKKIITLFLILTLALSLAGCGHKNGKVAEQDNTTGGSSSGIFGNLFGDPSDSKDTEPVTVYTATSLLRVNDSEENPQCLSPAVVSGETVYTTLRDFRSGSINITLYRLSPIGGEAQALGSLDGNLDRDLCASGSDGSLWFFGTSRQEDSYDYSPFLTQIGPDGSVLAQKDLRDIATSPIDMLSDGEGRLYFLDMGMNGAVLIALDMTGQPSVRFRLELKTDIGLVCVARTRDGNLAALNQTETGSLLRLIDGDSGTVSREIPLNGVGYEDILDGCGDYDLFLRAGAKVLGYDIASGSLTEELDLNMAGVYVYGKATALPGGGFVLLDDQWGNSELFLAGKESLPADSGVVLTLALTGQEYSQSREIIQEAVRRWNREHTDSKVEILDYSVYSTPASPDAGSLKLMTELMSGRAPDMYELSGMPASFYAKDRFEDLYPYLNADSEIDRNNLYENVLKVTELNGELRQLIPIFTLVSASANSSFTGGRRGFSPAEYRQIVQNNAQLEQLFTMTYSQQDLLDFLVTANLSSLVDWSQGECTFDSEFFRELLHLAAQQPASPSQDYRSRPILAAGKLMLGIEGYLTLSVDGALARMEVLGEDCSFPGLPCNSGTGSFIKPMIALAMSSASEHKDACWQFIRSSLTGRSWDYTGISIRRDLNQKTRNENVDLAVSYYGTYSSEAVQAALDKVEALIDTAGLAVADGNLMGIIREIAAGYFVGDKSLDDVVQDIQSRARIYVAEQTG